MTIIPTFNKHLKHFNERLKFYANTGHAFDFFELSDEIGMLQALETILNITEIDVNLMHDMFKRIVDNTCERLVRLYEHPDFIYRHTRKFEECSEICDRLKKFFDDAIDRTISDNRNANATNVLHYLLKQGRGEIKGGLTRRQIMDNALIMFGAVSRVNFISTTIFHYH